MDIKTIATGIGIVITIASLFVFQGQLIQRVEVLECKHTLYKKGNANHQSNP